MNPQSTWSAGLSLLRHQIDHPLHLFLKLQFEHRQPVSQSTLYFVFYRELNRFFDEIRAKRPIKKKKLRTRRSFVGPARTGRWIASRGGAGVQLGSEPVIRSGSVVDWLRHIAGSIMDGSRTYDIRVPIWSPCRVRSGFVCVCETMRAGGKKRSPCRYVRAPGVCGRVWWCASRSFQVTYQFELASY